MSQARALIAVSAALSAAFLLGCKPATDETASQTAGASAAAATHEGPVRMYFVPSMETQKLLLDAKDLTAALEEATGYDFEVEVPPSYAVVIAALDSNKADVAWLPTYAYVLAHDMYDVEVALQVVRDGEKRYRGMFVTRADSGITKLEDIAGKTIAYTDPASTSGYIYPSAMLAAKGIEPSEPLWSAGHPTAMLNVYNRRADVGCAYWSPPAEDGTLKDARKDILSTCPDAGEVLTILDYTAWIPNDNVSFRAAFPAGMRDKIVQALKDYVKSEEGAKVLGEMYNITDFADATDDDYDEVRAIIAESGQAPEEVLAAMDAKEREKAAKTAEESAAKAAESEGESEE